MYILTYIIFVWSVENKFKNNKKESPLNFWTFSFIYLYFFLK